MHATDGFLRGTALIGTPPQRLRLDTGLPLDEETPGNVRHYCLTNTLGGFFLRVLRGGEVSVGDSLVSNTHMTPLRILVPAFACMPYSFVSIVCRPFLWRSRVVAILAHLYGQVLSSRPHPEWTLKRLGDLLYGQASVDREGWVSWSGTEEERQALIAMPELAVHEWKDALLDPGIEMTRNY